MSGEGAIPATFESLGSFMESGTRWNTFVNTASIKNLLKEELTVKSEDTFKNAKTNCGVLFTKNRSTYSKATVYTEGTTYWYLTIDDAIFIAFNNWIKSQKYTIKVKKANSEDWESQEKNLEGIYRTVGVQEKPYGRLIDEAQYKYLPAYKFGVVASNKEVLNNFYIQVTREITTAEGTTDGLGRDANYTGVPKDGEYELKSGEYLLINYTDSKTDEAGNEKKSIINKVYPEKSTDKVIIRANFNLIDSTLHHNNHSWSKKDGFTFGGKQPEGMFTLGTNEQIEIREQVKVNLNEDTMYLYWTLNSDDPNAERNEFKFEEKYGATTSPNAYTLKEGEHLYYTNSKKQDLVYYGAGTLIVKGADTPTLYKYASSGEISEEEIMTNGLTAAIPW
jgi:hypothetical protein